jgi:hypothetical protein
MIKIRQFIDGWNDRMHPFIWTKTDFNARPLVHFELPAPTEMPR